MRLGSCGGGGARVCMHWDGQGGMRGGRSESEWVGIGRNRGFSDKFRLSAGIDPTYRGPASLEAVSESSELAAQVALQGLTCG